MNSPVFSDRLLTEKDAAAITKLSVAWFQRARWEGTGPKFIKFGRAVRYRQSDLDEYLKSRTRRSTVENAEIEEASHA